MTESRSASGAGPRIKTFVPGELDPEQRRLYQTIVEGPRFSRGAGSSLLDEQGGLRGPFNSMLLSPGLGEALQSVGATLRYSSTLTARAREVATLLVAHHCDCAFEWNAHAALARGVGLSEDEIESMRTPTPMVADQYEDVVARVARGILTEGDLADGLYAEAQRELGASTLFELVTLVGYYRLLAGVMATFRVPGR